ncbi:MFS transporter [Nocardiopsis gilva YIM 90087]|uniref:MFS transporter n=1 Tax=Nocardiopsis gilva YIM 90087 TaxID=1235441 RepID=A0A223S6I1_9ACTN|nr:MFS transporter [Nocardiopsis gilva]ASU83728.1 MFS transporter [Nocardiopsis gilva YIM 90087]
MNSRPTAQVPDNSPSADPAQRRREQRGWYVYDWANQVFITSVVTVLIGPYLSGLACTTAGAPDTATCTGGAYYVHPLGIQLHANAVYPAVTTVAILLQILLLPLLGSLADHSKHKKRWLFWLAFLGSVATSLLYFTGGDYVTTAALFLVANVLYGASLVIYNSFLSEIATPDERDRVSTVGWAIGYLGGALLLAAHLVLVLQADALGISQGEAVRIAIASVGIWWTGFTIIALKPLRNRFGELAARSARPNLRASTVQLVHTVRHMRQYPQTLLFLLAFIFFNDGIQAAVRYAAPFAAQDLQLDQGILMGTILMIQFVAFAGALMVGMAARRVGSKRAVLGTLVVWCVLVTLGYFLPAREPLLFLAMGVGIGLVLGGAQALARSMYSQLIPRGREAEYFSLYQISDRGSTFLGSLAVTIAVTLTGGYRAAIFSLIIFFLIGGFLLWKTDMRRGIREVGNKVPERL